MEPQELIEVSEKNRRGTERRVGVTIAIFAACLAIVTLIGHRLHTEEVVLQTKLADQWACYQAKNTRSQLYATDAALAQLHGPQGAKLAAGWNDRANDERRQADEIRHGNEELDRETRMTARRAAIFDSSEVFFEIAIVLCSIVLLTGAGRFWRVAFVAAALGVVAAAMGFLRL
jgi:hypothetical protein